MSHTGYAAFDTTIEKTNQVLKDIEEAYGWTQDRRQQSYDALRVVLQTLRDRLPVTEAVDLGAQLPILMRGLYYEGWKPSRVPVKMHREEFFDHIRREYGFDVEGGPELLVKRVLHALHRYVTPGEWNDIESTLPKDLAAVLAS